MVKKKSRNDDSTRPHSEFLSFSKKKNKMTFCGCYFLCRQVRYVGRKNDGHPALRAVRYGMLVEKNDSHPERLNINAI